MPEMPVKDKRVVRPLRPEAVLDKWRVPEVTDVSCRAVAVVVLSPPSCGRGTPHDALRGDGLKHALDPPRHMP